MSNTSITIRSSRARPLRSDWYWSKRRDWNWESACPMVDRTLPYIVEILRIEWLMTEALLASRDESYCSTRSMFERILWSLQAVAHGHHVLFLILGLSRSPSASPTTGRNGAARSAILVWRETGIVETLPAVDPKTGMLPRMWTAKIGSGYAGPAVADGRVFVTDRLADQEPRARPVLRRRTRQGALEARVRGPLHDQLSARPAGDADRRWRPRLHARRRRATCSASMPPPARSSGRSTCRPISARSCPQWGMAAAPLVDGDQLIVLAGGKPGALVVSLDKHTGDERWRALDDKEPGYCAARDPRIRRPAATHHLASAGRRRPRPDERQGAVGGAVRRAVRPHDPHAAQTRQSAVRHQLLQRPADDRPRRRRHVAEGALADRRRQQRTQATTACTRSCARRS